VKNSCASCSHENGRKIIIRDAIVERWLATVLNLSSQLSSNILLLDISFAYIFNLQEALKKKKKVSFALLSGLFTIKTFLAPIYIFLIT
jgi:hypothetical protein